MKKIIVYLQFIFWFLAISMWFLWIKQRILLFEAFDSYAKNIGYIVDTNDDLWQWYMLISIFKVAFIFTILYTLLPKHGFRVKTVMYSLLALLVSCFLEWLSATILFYQKKQLVKESVLMEWNYDFLSIFGTYLFWGFVAWILSAAIHWVKEYQNLKKLHKDQQSYRKLKEQLNPHFLFNSLNNLYEIAVQEDNEKLSEGVLNLTNTLRYTIDFSTQNKVLLQHEVEAIQSYIELQKIRFEEGELQLHTDINLSNSNHTITPLILLNYIENAFNHGFRFGEPAKISIRLTEKEGDLKLMIENTNNAVRNNVNGGNEKVKKILELNYPKKHTLRTEVKDNFYILELWIKLN